MKQTKEDQLIAEAYQKVNEVDYSQIPGEHSQAVRDAMGDEPAGEPQSKFRFILMGGGSGNVYGVSSASDINAALKDVLKDLTLMYNYPHSETPEYDDVAAMKKEVKSYDGYMIIVVPDSDEGQFGLLDTESNNPNVQAEIKDLNLIKYAEEFLNDK